MDFELKKEGNAPTQEEMLALSLRPGTRVDIVVKRDDRREELDVRRSILYDTTRDGFLILGQTAPPVATSMVGYKLEISFLVRLQKYGQTRWIRTGFVAVLDSIEDKYALGDGKRDAVLLVPTPRELEEWNLRMHYRLTPPAGAAIYIIPKDLRQIVDRDLQEFMQKARNDLLNYSDNPKQMLKEWVDIIKEIVVKAARTKHTRQASLLDISFGGAKLAHPEGWKYPLGSQLELTMVWDEINLDLPAEVVRLGKLNVFRTNYNRFTSVRFVNLPWETQSRLNKLIAKWTRDELARFSGLD